MPYARFSTEAETNPAYDAGGLVDTNPLDAIIAAKLQRDSPELIRRKAELEASTAARRPEIEQIQQAIEQRRIAREAPQPPLPAPAQSAAGPGWPRAALDAVNRGASFMRGVGDMQEQGALFGFGDEFGAGIGAGVDKLLGRSDESFGDVYRANLTERQETNQAFRKNHPVASTVAEIVGTLPTAAVGAAASAAPSARSHGKGCRQTAVTSRPANPEAAIRRSG